MPAGRGEEWRWTDLDLHTAYPRESRPRVRNARKIALGKTLTVVIWAENRWITPDCHGSTEGQAFWLASSK